MIDANHMHLSSAVDAIQTSLGIAAPLKDHWVCIPLVPFVLLSAFQVLALVMCIVSYLRVTNIISHPCIFHVTWLQGRYRLQEQ